MSRKDARAQQESDIGQNVLHFLLQGSLSFKAREAYNDRLGLFRTRAGVDYTYTHTPKEDSDQGLPTVDAASL